jgi:TRAP-type C4-dicarboxylate transport system substrate-binding protein
MTCQSLTLNIGDFKMNKKHVKWVLAHEPIELFIRAAKVFAAEVNVRAPEALEIEVMTMSEYAEKYNNGIAVDKHSLVDLLDSGSIEMSQTYTITLGKINKDFFALDLPFLFKDHDHATRVFEGEVGAGLLDSLQESKKVKGLAFTYSGGFRIIPGNETVAKIEDLRGVKLRTSHSPVAIETFKTLGANVVPMELEELSDNLASANVAVGESTYPRVYALGHDKVSKVINHTEHSLFLTSILIGTDFWNTLSPELQEIVSESAKVAARYERSISIDDIFKTQVRAEADGIEVVRMSAEEKARFAEATKVVYQKFENYFTPGLVSKIQSK